MDILGDELAGVVDLFGGLTRAELDGALEELAFKRGGKAVDSDGAAAAVEDALDSYHLVAVDREETILVTGPAAFATLPEGAEDLPHIMEVPERSIDRERAAVAARDRLVADAEAAVEAGDEERAAELLDVSYDLEAWGPVDAADVRDRLDGV